MLNNKQAEKVAQAISVSNDKHEYGLRECEIDVIALDCFQSGVRKIDNYNKMIDLCEQILTIAYDIDDDYKLDLLAHELKATLELEYEEE